MTRFTQSFDHPLDVLTFILDRDEASALIAVTHTEGGSVRSVGALLAVTEAGLIAGHISNGCVDHALITEAQDSLKSGAMKRLRLGAGSPYKDLKLPCGGAIDLLITPNFDRSTLEQAQQTLRSRKPVQLTFTDKGKVTLGDDTNAEGFQLTCTPKIHVRVAGVGEEVRALARLALAAGFDLSLASPNQDLLQEAEKAGAQQTTHLTSPDSLPVVQDDDWTAFVLLFHDHDWEPSLLKQALSGPAFYIGALGSVKTHSVRCDRLRALGVSEKALTRIHGPIGLIPSLRDASMVALSCLAEIVDCYVKAQDPRL